jgi:amino acid adenylation domain-containing protein
MANEAITGFRLSPQQERVWSLQQPGPSALGTASAVLEIRADIDPSRLRSALDKVAGRHEILRTVFVKQPGMKMPYQVILDTGRVQWEEVDLASMDSAAQEERLQSTFEACSNRVFDIENGPLLYVTLITRSSLPHLLSVSLPALCSDERSLDILAAELEWAYFSSESAEDPMQYADFVEWQYEVLDGSDTAAGRDFWREYFREIRLDTAGSLLLPFEKNISGAPFRPDSVSLRIGTGVDSSDFLFACWQVLLWRYIGPDFVVGRTADGRKFEELQHAIGLFAKTIPTGVSVRPDESVRAVVERVSALRTESEKWEESFAWPSTIALHEQQVPFHFGFSPSDVQTSFRVLQRSAYWTQYRLKLQCVREEDRLRAEFHYDSSRFDRASIERLGEQFRVLLEAAVSNPDTPVSRLPLLSEGERHRLLFEWNRTEAAYPEDRCWHELFEQQAALTPQRIAVRCGEQALSYTELNRQANQLAHHLRRLGVGPDSLVGLCLERSLSMMVAVLAIAKAGGAYVPLNPDTPKSRLLQQLAGAKVLISEESNLARLPDFSGPVLAIDYPTPPWASESTSNPQPLTTPDNLVYVIYTSGSTGVPKGVAVTHRNLVNYACFITQRLALSNHPDGLQFATVSTLAADLGNTSIYPALISGGSLHVIPYEVSTDSQRLARYFAAHPVDVLKIVPSHLQALLQGPEAAQILPRRYLITGGEALTRSLLEKILQLGGTCRVINHYGPTETTVGSLTLAIDDYAWQSSSTATIPLGRPIANTQAYILDAHGEPVPVGVVGELYIAGAGVTRGYLNQPERTAERFLPNRFVGQAGARMYRTGDLARYLPDGNIEFLGRADDQVKVRGFRIELGEIEAVLGAHPDIKQAVVLARENPLGDKQLLAYVVAHRDRPLSVPQVQAYLREQLPDYMVPSALMVLDKLPLTANGKIDRQALPQPDDIHTHSKAYVAPGTPTEEVIANIWAEVLRRDRISRDDNFFDLGGHSLLATQVISRVRDHFRTEVALRALFEAPTLSGFAAAVDQSHATSESTIVPLSRDRYRTAGPVR